MPFEFKMPQLGESVVEGTVGKWLKKVGEAVAEFEPLLELVTDKVDSEIPSPATGVLLEVRAQEGETVRVGQVIAIIGEQAKPAVAAEGEGQKAAPPLTTPTGPSPAAVQPGPTTTGRGYLTPVVAKIAAEHKVDLSQVEGTGRHGRISKQDILRFLEQPQSVAVPAEPIRPAAVPPAPSLPAASTPTALSAQVAPPALDTGDVEVPLSKMRQAIARHMRQAKDTAAHVTTFMEVDLSRVTAYRSSHQAEFAAEGIKLTYTPFVVQALVAGLKAYPMLNAVLAGDKMVYRRAVHIGLAVDLGDEGLIVPVIKHADEKSLRGLARAVFDLAERARSRALTPDDVQGATFTLTNHGITGSLAGTPIIPMPQVGILGMGAVQKRPVVIETEWGDTIAVRPLVYLSLSFDHRAIDGATADRFLTTVKHHLETFGS